MKVKRKSDGTVFDFDFVTYGRGEWGINLVAVNGDLVRPNPGDPDHSTEREARKVARGMVEQYTYVPNLGWCV